MKSEYFFPLQILLHQLKEKNMRNITRKCKLVEASFVD